ncbi:MAG: alpha-L-fucosidase [Kiritimatiellae bacterium]|nr:alpha-L-fucosidase [Kiritimatiellia bacterium]MDD5520445.1 alpha-L-fucosidase [Kiritimatiellia bacterium]
MRITGPLRFVLIFCYCLLGLPVTYVFPQDAVTDSSDRMQWFREAKFGMFIHWGPYSNLAGEWKGHQVPDGKVAEWIMQIFKIPVTEYRELAHQFNPVKFDAIKWARLAKSAGMKYLVITAKHHDGFAMYQSTVSKYNIVDWTPFKRDPLKELAQACKQEGIRFCFYYSHREDWNDPDAYGNDWDYDVTKKNFEKYLEQKSKPQVRELLTNYGPVGLIWFDRGLYTPKQAQEFVELARSLQPGCLISGRVGNYGQELMGDYQSMSDNGMPTGGLDEYWETPQTLNGTWGYNKFDNNWKSSQTVIRRLVEIVSKGGNYLLNIGPMGDGSIPEPTLEVFDQVGAWMNKNSESIYGASAGPFPEISWGRCTVKGEILYLHVFDWPEDRTLKLSGLKNAVAEVYPLLDRSSRLPFKKDGDTLSIQLPAGPSHPADTVIVVKITGKLNVEPPVVIQKDGKPLQLNYLTARTAGKASKRFNRTGGFHISRWTAPEDTASWHLKMETPGCYRVKINYSAQPEWKGAKYQVLLGSNSLAAVVEPTGDWFKYKMFDLGTFQIERGGDWVLVLRPENSTSHYLMYFESLVLEKLQ